MQRVDADRLTDEVIAAVVARAERAYCPPGDGRCYGFPDAAAQARTTCTPEGRCVIGWVVRDAGRDSRDVWVDLASSEGHFGKRQDPRS
jgi:hypothetical protein